MRYALALSLASSLLVGEAWAAPRFGLQHMHQRRALVTNEVIVTAAIYVTELADGSYSTGVPTIIGTATVTPTEAATQPSTSVHLGGEHHSHSFQSFSSVAATSSAVAVVVPVSSSVAVVAPVTPTSEAASTTLTTFSTRAASSSTSSSSEVSSSTSSSTSSEVIPTTSAAPSTTSAAHSTSAAPSSTSTSTSTSAKPSSTSTPTSSSKRGVPYNSASLAEDFVGSSVSWAYNWGSGSSGLTSQLEYVPMLWGLSSEMTSAWPAAASAAIASGSTSLLAFNEPDLSSQSNIDYNTAATGYKTYMQPFAGKAKLVSPAVTNGGAPMGLTWLTNFIDACSDCTIDAVAIHWYDSATNIGYFQSYVESVYAATKKPIWITEFQGSGSDAEQATFLETVIPWLESQDYVERYAYFMASDGILIEGTALSTIGSAFADTA